MLIIPPSMTSRFPRLIPLLALAALPLLAAEPSAWPTPTAEMKPWARWWWPASAVDKENLTLELTAYAEAGLGGVEITPIYGAKGFEPRFIPFLSPQYVEMLAYTGAEAKRLGMVVDMATGTGWPFGGSQVTPEDAELKITVKEDKLVAGPTGFKVKRAAPGGSGLVLNPYSTSALAHYLAPFDTAFAPLPKGTIHGQFHDSFEYTANWSSEFETRFHEMHGYDLRDHAAEFGGKGDPDTIARIKSDYRETLSALHLDYVRAWVAWAHKNGQVAREQAHGAPANLLDLYGASDVPETEIFGSTEWPIPGMRSDPAEVSYNHPQPLISRFASSAAHVSGKNLVSSETFTWLRQHFHEAPSQMKPELDSLFLSGINHVVFHGTCYSPADAVWPGWLFYASTQFNPRNSLWRDLGEGLNAYITRCQSLLQSGQPDNDVLIYWPVYDLWHNANGYDLRFGMHEEKWITESTAGKLARQLIDKGMSFDFVSDAQLVAATVENAAIKTAGGAHYRAVVIPKAVHMPAETLAHLRQLAQKGATLIFEGLPESLPGFAHSEQQENEFKKLLASPELTQSVVGPDVVAALLQHDVTSEPVAATGLGFLRRRNNSGYVYFFTNLTGKPFDGWLALGTPAQNATLLDPLTGRAGQAALIPGTRGKAQIYLQLRPDESVIIKTVGRTEPSQKGKAWLYKQTAGQPVPLTNEWRVAFTKGGPELPPAFTATELKSWTEQGGEAERFAGTARYETEFEVPAGVTADDWQLDLNDVRETARVFVNGQQAELLWALPFRTPVGTLLKPGKNTLAIEVTNLSANRIRDLDKRGVVWKNFYEINFVDPHYRRLDAATWPVMPSGLLGPITLTPLKKFDPAASVK